LPSPSTSPHPSPPRPFRGQQTARSSRPSHPDPHNCSNIYSMRATTHGARSSQQSRSTALLTKTDVHAENELQAWGATASHLSAVSQHPPTKKAIGTCASALPTSANKSTTPSPAEHLQVPLLSNSSTWGAQTDSNSRCYSTLEKCG
jgi:hypothetical protein